MVILGLGLLVVGMAFGHHEKAKVFFLEPKDGAKLSKKIHVKMGVEGMKILKAGEQVDDVHAGHHHLIIDGVAIPAGQPVPADEKHIHFGKGQTEADLELAVGEHTLTLQFADGAHRSFGPKMSQTIKVKVQ